jgi:hypothetical protein
MALSRLHIYYYYYVLFSLHGFLTSTHILLPFCTVLSTWLYHFYTYSSDRAMQNEQYVMVVVYV